MCGRFTLRNKEEVQDLTGEAIEENYNVAPSTNILTITDSPEWRKWSYSPSYLLDKTVHALKD